VPLNTLIAIKQQTRAALFAAFNRSDNNHKPSTYSLNTHSI